MAVLSTKNLADSLRDVAVACSGVDAVRSVAHGYRDFATNHPGQYASTLLPPSSAEDDLIASHRAIIDLFSQILEAFRPERESAVHAARAMRSAIHGFVALETTDALTNSTEDRATGPQACLRLLPRPLGRSRHLG